jgi:hypothetical protein
MEDDGLGATVVLTAHAPHTVESVSPCFSTMYGFYESQVLNRTLQFIHGPRTDLQLWSGMIKEALSGKSVCNTLSTCASNCDEVMVDVTMTPASRQEGRITHIIVHLVEPLHPDALYGSEDITSSITRTQQLFEAPHGGVFATINQDEQMRHIPLPAAHVQEEQHAVTLSQGGACSSSNELYSFHQPSASGLYSLHQTVDTLPFHMDMRWGDPSVATHFPIADSSQNRLQAFATSCSVEDGWMSHVAVHEGAWQPTPQAQLHIAAAEVIAEFNNLQGYMSISSCASSPLDWKQETNCSAIFPRRKAGQVKSEALGPVLITLEVLESLSDAPLGDAAKKLGISPTAIKKACRKLGVLRWPYRKHVETSSHPELLSRYNDAYVRKIYRKYSTKAPKPGSGKSSSPAAKQNNTSSPSSAPCSPDKGGSGKS